MHNLLRLIRDLTLGIQSQWTNFVLVTISVAVGAGCCAVLISVLRGLQEEEKDLINALGADVFALTSNSSAGSASMNLTLDSVLNIRKFMPQVITSAIRKGQINANGINQPLQIIQTDNYLADVRAWSLSRGRFIDPHDIESRARVAVVSSALAKSLNWHVGTFALLGDQPYQVIGELNTSRLSDQPEALTALAAEVRSVFIPVSIPVDWQDADNIGAASVDTVVFRATYNANKQFLSNQISAYLVSFGIERDSLSWITPASLTRGIEKIRKTITASLGSIAALLLLVASVTLSGTMSINVRERTPEIGLRRSLGATRGDIRSLFIAEGVLIAAGGSLAGILTAAVLCGVTMGNLPIPLAVDAWMICIPLLLYLLVGAAASFWPAQFAAQLTPADCMRN